MGTRRKLDREGREARNAARLEIVQAVNRFRVRFHAYHRYAPPLFEMKHLQQAVRIVRHHGLVKPKVLARAGFREAA